MKVLPDSFFHDCPIARPILLVMTTHPDSAQSLHKRTEILCFTTSFSQKDGSGKVQIIKRTEVDNTSGYPWPKATVKSPVGARDLRPVWSFISFIFSYLLLPCPLPCQTDRTAGVWVGHVIRCVILKTRSVGLLPLGDESLVSKRSWEASCMSAALKKRDLLLVERPVACLPR